MDRVISLLAALVGLIALAGAVLVHINGDLREQQLATELATLKAAVAASAKPPAAAVAPANDGTIDALFALQNRIASLERTTAAQASGLAAAGQGPMASSATAVADLSGATPAPAPAGVLAADGPTTDCIPLGTRFMGTSGDSFPLCKTRLVLKVASVSDGIASIGGTGDVAAGSTVPYATNCSLAVFSADSSGYAEMRVTCQ